MRHKRKAAHCEMSGGLADDSGGYRYQQHHYTTSRFGFATDLAGLLAQAKTRQAQANSRDDNAAAAAHQAVKDELLKLARRDGEP